MQHKTPKQAILVSLTERIKLALDKNTPTEIVNLLAFDCTRNVSYHAIQNPNCTVTRYFNENEIEKCVKCTDVNCNPAVDCHY